MSIQFEQNNGLVKINVADHNNYKTFLYIGNTAPSTSSVAFYNNTYLIDGTQVELLADTASGTKVFYKYFETDTTFFVILASTGESEDELDIVEKSASCSVTRSGYYLNAGNIVLGDSDPATISFYNEATSSATDSAVLGSNGVGFLLNNISAPSTTFTGLSYAIDIVKVVGGNADEFDNGSDYKACKAIAAANNCKFAKITSVSLASGTSSAVVYDSSVQYKEGKNYCYIAFLYILHGPSKEGGWRIGQVSSTVPKRSHTVSNRAVDDLYREHEPARVVAAQNAARPQKITTKKFAKIGDGGSYFYSVLIKSTSDLSKEDTANVLPQALQNWGVIKYTGISTVTSTVDPETNETVTTTNIDGDKDGLCSYQLSGIGKITPEYKEWVPVIDGTIKLTLSAK